MRIGIVSDHYYPQLGGITEQVHGQATEFTRRGHEVTVLTPKLFHVPRTVDPEYPPAEGFEVVNVGTAYPSYVNGSECLQTVSPRLYLQLDRIYKERQFDVVHVHNPFGVMLPITAIMRSRAPVTVATYHSVVPPGYKLLNVFKPVLWKVMRRLDGRIAVSDAIVDSIEPFFPGLDFDVIPNAIDLDFFSPGAEPVERLMDGRRNILFVGRFDPRNGLDHMLGAFEKLRSRRDDCRLVVIGDGPLRNYYKRMVPPHLEHDVLFEGRMNRMRPRYLASAELLCTPCELASFGMVLLEAMSSGTPVVASRISGFQLVMEDGIQGLMVDRPSDTAGLADALEYLLENPEQARAMGVAGRRRAIEHYSWPLVADRMEELYERLGAPARPRQPLPAVATA
jgi:phosphatidylinositol alpha-mannosyltransferase